jgi:AmmeMemoRadiSam system protein B
MSTNSIREASHAGSWYESDGSHLDQQLSTWLSEAVTAKNDRLKARAIIAPHAGYSYSGPTAAFAYKHIDPTDIDRVFLLGPSHHYSLNNCALTNHTQYETPLYNIKVDTQTSTELYKTGLFSIMNKQQDSDEHSLEMHLPYIAKVFEKYDFNQIKNSIK